MERFLTKLQALQLKTKGKVLGWKPHNPSGPYYNFEKPRLSTSFYLSFALPRYHVIREHRCIFCSNLPKEHLSTEKKLNQMTTHINFFFTFCHTDYKRSLVETLYNYNVGQHGYQTVQIFRMNQITITLKKNVPVLGFVITNPKN